MASANQNGGVDGEQAAEAGDDDASNEGGLAAQLGPVPELGDLLSLLTDGDALEPQLPPPAVHPQAQNICTPPLPGPAGAEVALGEAAALPAPLQLLPPPLLPPGPPLSSVDYRHQSAAQVLPSAWAGGAGLGAGAAVPPVPQLVPLLGASDAAAAAGAARWPPMQGSHASTAALVHLPGFYPGAYPVPAGSLDAAAAAAAAAAATVFAAAMTGQPSGLAAGGLVGQPSGPSAFAFPAGPVEPLAAACPPSTGHNASQYEGRTATSGAVEAAAASLAAGCVAGPSAVAAASPEQDPLTQQANALGLKPGSGRKEQLSTQGFKAVGQTVRQVTEAWEARRASHVQAVADESAGTAAAANTAGVTRGGVGGGGSGGSGPRAAAEVPGPVVVFTSSGGRYEVHSEWVDIQDEQAHYAFFADGNASMRENASGFESGRVPVPLDESGDERVCSRNFKRCTCGKTFDPKTCGKEGHAYREGVRFEICYRDEPAAGPGQKAVCKNFSQGRGTGPSPEAQTPATGPGGAGEGPSAARGKAKARGQPQALWVLEPPSIVLWHVRPLVRPATGSPSGGSGRGGGSTDFGGALEPHEPSSGGDVASAAAAAPDAAAASSPASAADAAVAKPPAAKRPRPRSASASASPPPRPRPHPAAAPAPAPATGAALPPTAPMPAAAPPAAASTPAPSSAALVPVPGPGQAEVQPVWIPSRNRIQEFLLAQHAIPTAEAFVRELNDLEDPEHVLGMRFGAEGWSLPHLLAWRLSAVLPAGGGGGAGSGGGGGSGGAADGGGAGSVAIAAAVDAQLVDAQAAAMIRELREWLQQRAFREREQDDAWGARHGTAVWHQLLEAQRTPFGDTPLTLAARGGREAALRELLEGASWCSQVMASPHNYLALQTACRSGQAGAARILLAALARFARAVEADPEAARMAARLLAPAGSGIAGGGAGGAPAAAGGGGGGGGGGAGLGDGSDAGPAGVGRQGDNHGGPHGSYDADGGDAAGVAGLVLTQLVFTLSNQYFQGTNTDGELPHGPSGHAILSSLVSEPAWAAEAPGGLQLPAPAPEHKRDKARVLGMVQMLAALLDGKALAGSLQG